MTGVPSVHVECPVSRKKLVLSDQDLGGQDLTRLTIEELQGKLQRLQQVEEQHPCLRTPLLSPCRRRMRLCWL